MLNPYKTPIFNSKETDWNYKINFGKLLLFISLLTPLTFVIAQFYKEVRLFEIFYIILSLSGLYLIYPIEHVKETPRNN